MDKAEAIAFILEISRRERQPNSPEWLRMIRAFRTLELTVEQMQTVARGLDVTRRDGRPWGAHISEANVPWLMGPQPDTAKARP